MPSPSRVYYHVTMQPHRRLPALFPEVEAIVREVIGTLSRNSDFVVLEVGVVPTHIHLLIEKAPWADLRDFVRDFQVQTSARIFACYPQLALDMRTTRFWTDGGFHYTRHTSASLDTVRRYIRDQKKKHGLA